MMANYNRNMLILQATVITIANYKRNMLKEQGTVTMMVNYLCNMFIEQVIAITIVNYDCSTSHFLLVTRFKPSISGLVFYCSTTVLLPLAGAIKRFTTVIFV
jgi:hypothetical protein